MIPIDSHSAWYVVNYFGHLMTQPERAAYWHLTATIKATHRDDAAAQEEAMSNKINARFLSADPEVLRLASVGWQQFLKTTAQRILSEHADQVFLNCCPRCGRLAKTPRAKQCRFCRHDWRE